MFSFAHVKMISRKTSVYVITFIQQLFSLAKQSSIHIHKHISSITIRRLIFLLLLFLNYHYFYYYYYQFLFGLFTSELP